MNYSKWWITWLVDRWRPQQAVRTNVNCRHIEHRHVECTLRRWDFLIATSVRVLLSLLLLSLWMVALDLIQPCLCITPLILAYPIMSCIWELEMVTVDLIQTCLCITPLILISVSLCHEGYRVWMPVWLACAAPPSQPVTQSCTVSPLPYFYFLSVQCYWCHCILDAWVLDEQCCELINDLGSVVNTRWI